MSHWSPRTSQRVIAILILALVALPIPNLAVAAGEHGAHIAHPQMTADNPSQTASPAAHCTDHTVCYGKCCVTCVPAAAAFDAGVITGPRHSPVQRAGIPALHSSLIISTLIRPPRVA